MDRKSFATKIFLSVVLFSAFGMSIPKAQGQTVTATIVGQVTDPTGAVIPGAKVVVTNEATNVAREVATNQAGQYVVPFLPPGKYTVSAEQKGFKKKVVSGLEVEVDQRVAANLVLEVGEVTQVVRVEGAAPLLATESSGVAQTIDNKKVVDLPLNGRQFMELAFLVPGVHASAPGHFNEILQGFAAAGAGGRPTNNNFTLDGVDNVSPNCGYFSVSPSIDSVQEFKIETNNYSAEFGRTSGIVVNVATKSGTNDLHGSAFEFIRNDKLGDARNFFNPTTRPEQIRRHEFGGSIGGPVYIPGVYNGKNRTFFFYNEEHLREIKPLTQTATIPTGPILNGDFSQAGFTVFDPLTTRPDPNNPGAFIRDPFQNNIIPPGRISPVALAVLKFYPTPNNPGDPSRNFINLAGRNRRGFQITTRGDHQFTDRDSFFTRFSESRQKTFTPGVIPGRNDDLLIFTGVNDAINWVHTISPTFINEFRAGYNRLNFGRVSPTQGTDFAGQFGIKGVPGGKTAVFPIFGISGFTGLGDIEPYGNIDNIFQFVDIATKVKGRHSIKFGIDVRRILNDYFITRSPSGSYSFSGGFTAQPGQFLPNGLADFLLGFPTSNEITYVGDIGRTRTTNWNAFIQDDWKVTNNLTVNLGLRYELFTPPKDKFGRQGNLDPTTGILVYARNAPLDNPLPNQGITEADLPPHIRVPRESIILGDNDNFAPRVGFAYKLPFTFTPNTVIRAAYGISYVYLPFSDIGVNTQRFVPFAIRPSLTASTDSLPTTIPNFDFPAGGARAVLRSGTPLTLAGLDPNFQYGQSQQWSFDIQREFAGNWLVDLGYIGNTAHHLGERYPTNFAPLGPGPIQPRRRFPRFSAVTQDQSDINANYNAFTASVQKHFTKGYSFLVSYTWAKAINDGSEVYGTPGEDAGPQDPQNFKLERGLAPDDVRHRLSVSYVWELPFGQGKPFGANFHPFFGSNWLISGWQVNSIMGFQTGFHTTATGGSFLNNGQGGRPDQVCNPNQGFTFSVNEAFNTNCFVSIAKTRPFSPGTAPRNSIQTHQIGNVDLSIFKNNKIGERLNVQFRWEMFNVLNHPNFAVYYALPVRNRNSSQFGKIFAASDPRLMQVAVKLLF